MSKGKLRMYVIIVSVLFLMAGILTQTIFYLNWPSKISMPKLRTSLKKKCAIPAEQEKALTFDKLSKSEIIQKTKKLQIPFIENEGQMDEEVSFYAKTFGGTVFVAKRGEIVYSLPENNFKNLEKQTKGLDVEIRSPEAEY